VPWPAIPDRRGLPAAPSASRRSIEARPLMRDVTSARPTWNPPLRASYDSVRGGVPPCVDERYEQGERGEPALLLPPSLTASGESHPLPMERTFLTVSFGTGGTGSTVPRSAMVVLAKYQDRLGSARNSAAEIAPGDIMEAD
jgi:hypothetical protein